MVSIMLFPAEAYGENLLPKVAPIAVDSAFKENRRVEDWAKEALNNIKPVLLNSEALEKESNLMIIIESETNKRPSTNQFKVVL